MIKAENIETWGFEHAIRGMRNPLNSWDKSDSGYCESTYCSSDKCRFHDKNCNHVNNGDFVLGQADLDLMTKLCWSGVAHRKYTRQIFVSMDVTAPLYWWKEFDTYKIGTTSNSCSTMHTIHKKEFNITDFSHEHLNEESMTCLKEIIDVLNYNRGVFNGYVALCDGTTTKDYWWQMIQLLPTSYNQKRTITMNYENVFNIMYQRDGHKLDEWRDFVDVLSKLPYIKEIEEG